MRTTAQAVFSMQQYANRSGDSGVTDYRIEEGAIVVRFEGGEVYRYTHASAGVRHVSAMQRLARVGRGLSTYISQHRDEVDYER
jgi:hypothetical protein